MSFLTQLCCKQIEDDLWELTEDLVYDAGRHGVFTAKKGFKTDFASVPRAPIAWWFCGGLGEAAAVIHDYLYKYNGVSKDTADRVFYMGLRDMGVGPFRAAVMYQAVKMGGWGMWKKYRSEDNARVHG